MPETTRSFRNWQPTHRWRPLPWLANPGNPAMSPHEEGEKTSTHHTDKTVERKGGTGEGRQPPRSPHAQENANTQKMLTKNANKTPTTPYGPRTRGILVYAHIYNKPLTTRVKLVLLVVNSVKMHVTAYKINSN